MCGCCQRGWIRFGFTQFRIIDIRIILFPFLTRAGWSKRLFLSGHFGKSGLVFVTGLGGFPIVIGRRLHDVDFGRLSLTSDFSADQPHTVQFAENFECFLDCAVDGAADLLSGEEDVNLSIFVQPSVLNRKTCTLQHEAVQDFCFAADRLEIAVGEQQLWDAVKLISFCAVVINIIHVNSSMARCLFSNVVTKKRHRIHPRIDCDVSSKVAGKGSQTLSLFAVVEIILISGHLGCKTALSTQRNSVKRKKQNIVNVLSILSGSKEYTVWKR